MSKTLKVVLAAVVVVVLVGGAGVWYFVLRDTAETTASLDAIGTPSGTAAGPARTSADGNWKVAPGTDIFVGYRVEELFAGQTVKKTATGRTTSVTGTMTVAGSSIPAVEIKADTTKLKSDETRRDSAIGTRGLETQKFPEATFKLTTPITLPSPPVKDQEVSVTATGDLTLHGVTKSVQVPLKAKWTGPTITVAGSTSIAFADYKISPIEISILKTDDNGVLELQLAFVPT
jgi:polyisoprenoid-binding protein YceI